MDAPAVQPFPVPFIDYSMAFRLLIVSAIPVILMLLLCLFFPRASTRYDDHDPETATDTHHHHHHHHFQLRSHDTERVRELMEELKRAMMEASDGFVYDKTKDSKKDNNGGDAAECAICLDDFKDGDVCRALHECDHVFHKGCLVPSLMKSNTCPMCRVVVPYVWNLPD